MAVSFMGVVIFANDQKTSTHWLQTSPSTAAFEPRANQAPPQQLSDGQHRIRQPRLAGVVIAR